jgi:transposase-like protein
MGRKSKLSKEEQASLYREAITTRISYRELGKKYGVSHETARNLVDTWIKMGKKRREIDKTKFR